MILSNSYQPLTYAVIIGDNTDVASPIDGGRLIVLMDPEQLDACIIWWQNVLNVLHWTIENHIVPAKRMSALINLMEFRPTRARMHATILIREDVLSKYDVFGVQRLIVHELSHLIYDPIAEEHFNQIKYGCDHSRDDENTYRFTQALEKAVEHTAQMLCKAIPMQEKWG